MLYRHLLHHPPQNSLRRRVVVGCVIIITFFFAGGFFFTRPFGIVALKRILSGNSFVISGEGRWLFYRGSLDYALLPWWNSGKKIVELHRFAQENGVRLIVIPMPNSIDIYPEQLDQRLGSFAFLGERRRKLFRYLREHNVNLVDLYDRCIAKKDSVEVFFNDEPHITSLGILWAAQQTAREFFDAPDSLPHCIGDTTIRFVGLLSEKLNPHTPGKMIQIYKSQRGIPEKYSDTLYVFGDSYGEYLVRYRGGFINLLGAFLPLKRIFLSTKFDRGFYQAQNIVNTIKKSHSGTTILWIFTGREFCKPLRYSINR